MIRPFKNLFPKIVRLWVEGDVTQRRSLFLLGVLVTGLLGMAGLWGYYLTTRKPISSVLPAAPAVAQVFKPHYLFSIYDVEKPIGIAVSPDGSRIYVTESSGDRLVKVFSRDGELLSSFSPTTTNPAERTPVYIETTENGEVFVTDRRQHAVFVYDAEGVQLRSLTPPPGEDFWAPLGLAFGNGKMYLTDITKHKHQVRVYNGEGQFEFAFGKEGKEPGEFWYPNGIEVDREGRIYVSDSNNGRLQVFDERGQLLYKLGGLNLPRGTAMDEEQRLYVADAVGQRVLVYGLTTQPMELLFDFGDFGFGDGQFNYPNDIAVDHSGRLYIADRENNRVQVWSY